VVIIGGSERDEMNEKNPWRPLTESVRSSCVTVIRMRVFMCGENESRNMIERGGGCRGDRVV
jgi:hypothetical protein